MIASIYKVTNKFAISLILLLLPLLYKLSSKVFNRDKYYIDGKHGTIMKNNRLLTSFADIASITISPQKSELIVVLKNKDKIKLIKSKSHLGLRKVEEIISILTKISFSK